MTIKTLIQKLQAVQEKEGGNYPVEIETPHEIIRVTSVRFEETDAERGCSCVVVGNGSVPAMRIVVVKQAWAWMIVNGFKDIENRTWHTTYRGPLLIQASKHKISAAEYALHSEFARERGCTLPPKEDLPVGGIVGIVNLVDSVTSDLSPWFQGPVGWRLRDAHVLPFTACHGMLGIYPAPEAIINELREAIPAKFRAKQGRLL